MAPRKAARSSVCRSPSLRFLPLTTRANGLVCADAVRPQFADQHVQFRLNYTTVYCDLDHPAAHPVHDVRASRHRLDVAVCAPKRALARGLDTEPPHVRVLYQLVHKVLSSGNVRHLHQVHASVRRDLPTYTSHVALEQVAGKAGACRMGVQHVAVRLLDVQWNGPGTWTPPAPRWPMV